MPFITMQGKMQVKHNYMLCSVDNNHNDNSIVLSFKQHYRSFKRCTYSVYVSVPQNLMLSLSA